MAELRFSVDRCDHSIVSGWIDQEAPASSLAITLDDRRICELSPTAFRQDLLDDGLGDGKRAFTFPLTGYLKDGLNRLALSVDGDEILKKDLPFHRAMISGGSIGFGENQELFNYSQRRWLADEPDESLTWGRLMTGDSLWEVYREARRFVGAENILEIGPGYGRLLEAALKLKAPFGSYMGVDLSPARAKRLGGKFRQRNIRFQAGDINVWRSETKFDVAIVSVTFDFLYPDCRRALANLRGQMAPGAHLFADFIPGEQSTAAFEPNGTYIRCYPQAEIKELLSESGFAVRKVVPCTLGKGALGPVERSVVIAQAVGNTGSER
jgi:SAM-dependent methyltransferase